LSESGIDDLMQSFLLKNCAIRQELGEILSAYGA
jgi:hypothetical protein